MKLYIGLKALDTGLWTLEARTWLWTLETKILKLWTSQDFGNNRSITKYEFFYYKIAGFKSFNYEKIWWLQVWSFICCSPISVECFLSILPENNEISDVLKRRREKTLPWNALTWSSVSAASPSFRNIKKNLLVLAKSWKRTWMASLLVKFQAWVYW